MPCVARAAGGRSDSYGVTYGSEPRPEDAACSVGHDLRSSGRVPSAIVLTIQPIDGFLPETAHVLPVAEDRRQDVFRRIGLGPRQLNDFVVHAGLIVVA